MFNQKMPRYLFLAIILILGVYWVVASASQTGQSRYANSKYLINGHKLQQRLAVEPIVVIDVRDDKHFDGKLIPGAIRMPWSLFRSESTAKNMGGLFVGIEKAQAILGEHGVFRNDTIVLYDSVKRDGGATASYVFWILDMLGHKSMMLLERGIDGWIDSGGDVVNDPVEREALLYQAPVKEIKLRHWVDEDFIYPRLGDPYYQIIDVRSREEYLGEKLNPALDETPLKSGHIPGAYNINYEDNWTDTTSKAIKSHAQLLELYRGISPDRAVIVYCHSARRSSFSYFILRLLGFEDVMVYDNSWFGWGQPDQYYPVETRPNAPAGQALPVASQQTRKRAVGSSQPRSEQPPAQANPPDASKKGYISCGG